MSDDEHEHHGGFFPFAGGAFVRMPPEMLAQIREQHEHDKLVYMDHEHLILDLFSRLSSDDQSTLAHIFDQFVHLDESVPILATEYKMMLIMLRAQNDRTCPTCGVNHEDELNKLMSGEHEPTPEPPTPEPTPTPPVPDPEPPKKYEPNDGKPATKTARQRFYDDLDKYNVETTVNREVCNRESEVRCLGCGMEYTSLNDRMLKGVKDCPGCHHKAKWG